ncbi:MAG: PTS sugar transporter subunit IIA [Deltaproteobacteria bacterium]|nr:PTS sugar transporter subunit IIA [Deltaproteobacteria bacterium]
MRLADVLRQDCIIADLKARSKNDLLDEMVTGVLSKIKYLEKERVMTALLEREKLGTTGIGHGVAIPHGKIRGLREIIVFFGRSRRGVEFNSMDNMPVYIFFLIIAPENSAAAHLKVLASISHLLKNHDFRGKLMSAQDSSEIFRIITEAERKTGIA